MKKTQKAFLLSVLFWLLPGLVLGWVWAAFLSFHEYDYASRLTGAVLEGESLPSALKYAAGKKSPAHPQTDDGYLKQYGYSPLGSMTHSLPYTLTVSILLFQAAGCAVFLGERKKARCQAERIQELTLYLQSADHGEASALRRKEDAFSYLEDEIYKTVARLYHTKEKAVKDHEILTARIADIAHQLKTPLTSMSLMAELLEPSQEEDREYLDRLKRQVERLRLLVEGLLTLAKLDSHTLEFHMEAVEVEELLKEACDPLKEIFSQKNITVNITPGPLPSTDSSRADSTDTHTGSPVTYTDSTELWILTDLHWSAQALLNVLKNCGEHTPENGSISVVYEQNPLYTQILIEDSGPGFLKKDLPHIFERFYRGACSSNDNAGIGLALAKSLLEAQKAQIQADNSPLGHALFTIRFYK